VARGPIGSNRSSWLKAGPVYPSLWISPCFFENNLHSKTSKFDSVPKNWLTFNCSPHFEITIHVRCFGKLWLSQINLSSWISFLKTFNGHKTSKKNFKLYDLCRCVSQRASTWGVIVRHQFCEVRKTALHQRHHQVQWFSLHSERLNKIIYFYFILLFSLRLVLHNKG